MRTGSGWPRRPPRSRTDLARDLATYAREATTVDRTLTVSRYAMLIPRDSGETDGRQGSWTWHTPPHAARRRVTCRETLIDILVHSKDIALPLGRTLPVHPDAAAAAATRVWELRWPFEAPKRFAGFHLVATEAPWEVGAGEQVGGPMEAILLVLTGRLVELPRLSGPGVPALRARLAGSS